MLYVVCCMLYVCVAVIMATPECALYKLADCSNMDCPFLHDVKQTPAGEAARREIMQRRKNG